MKHVLKINGFEKLIGSRWYSLSSGRIVEVLQAEVDERTARVVLSFESTFGSEGYLLTVFVSLYKPHSVLSAWLHHSERGVIRSITPTGHFDPDGFRSHRSYISELERFIRLHRTQIVCWGYDYPTV